VPFMKRCRELCTEYGALLVLDEVMTGFRVALGGAQSVYAKEIPGFEPDMTVMGKVIGGGMPLAAFGAKRAVMEHLAPLGSVYQAGTLSGNPVATACGLATLNEICKPGFYEDLSRKTRTLISGLTEAATAEGVPFCGDLQPGHENRWRQIQPVVPQPAGPRCLHCAGAVRSRFCKCSAH